MKSAIRGGWRNRPARRYLGAMTRILLLIPSRTYRTADFIEAASALDIEVVVGMEERPPLADVMGERWLALSLTDVASGRQAIVDYAQEHSLDAVIPIDDGSTLVAAAGAAALGLPHNRFGAVAASRDKARTRELLAVAGLNTPRFRTWPADADPEEIPSPTFDSAVTMLQAEGWRSIYDIVDLWSDPALGGEWYAFDVVCQQAGHAVEME